MNKANLKSYAPKARLDFIKAVTERANVLGISASGVMPAEVRGDVALIDGREWPAKVAGQRDELISRIKRHGFEQTMDEVAYTWFNRFAALRYMEIHDYLGHGWRVLSSRDGGLPEILRHASEVTLPGLNADRAREMQLAGNQDNELYKLLLVAQCNELSRVMPFLFERIDDETELLLPENLLRTDSIVAKLVEQVPEEDWQEIEVIGWLYQFYISERKEQVIGKVVKSEDIPAATQLFTPNWIVQYLVQNSVGRLWLIANPTSTLASQWPYYIQPAEQTPEVQAQLDALIQTRIREDGETLNPETITVLDPACGSGHILVVAYDLLKAIYLERGYQPRAIPRLILEKNLYGLDIDDRAAQLAAFALLMKARADDRRLFSDPPRLNLLSLREGNGLDADELASHLAPFGVRRALLKTLLDSIKHAKTFGSLLELSSTVTEQLAALTDGLQRARAAGDMYARQAADDVLPLVLQASMLGMRFDAVVANPPYMGSKYHTSSLKEYLKSRYKGFDKDLFAAFSARSSLFAKPSGEVALMTSNVWMSLSSYETMREWLIRKRTLRSLIHLSNSGFEGATVFICAFQYSNFHIEDAAATFVRLTDFSKASDQGPRTLEAIAATDCAWRFEMKAARFSEIPGSIIGYWLGERTMESFSLPKLGDYFEPQVGLQTSNTDRFIRLWQEVSFQRLCRDAQSNDAAQKSGCKWFPLDKGGDFRRWYGNNNHIVNWQADGSEIKRYVAEKYPYLNGNVDYVVKDRGFFFRPGVTWAKIGSGSFSVRATFGGSIFSDAGMKIPLSSQEEVQRVAGYLNSSVAAHFLGCLSPTMNFEKGSIASLPYISTDCPTVTELIDIYRRDWDEREESYDFDAPGFVKAFRSNTIGCSWNDWARQVTSLLHRAIVLEKENNRAHITAFSLGDEVRADIDETKVPLMRPNRDGDCRRLLSYAIGCFMGRYSLDGVGLIYAHAGNVGFDSTRYTSLLADTDGILPITDERWFEDDAASRVREFVRAVWGADAIDENMGWVGESIGAKGGETPDEAVRRYLADKFFKDHLQTYKKRPIYWLFSSGKQGAFQALVYLHRYNEGTLARMRAEYVVPLIAKMASRLEMLDKDVVAASSAAVRTKLQKQIEALRKKQIELLAYDEKLRHYADMRISLDLDDGVKVNYAKFGDLVAESKAITGSSDE
ncbi:BREX-1 system adenine-specific DNA-methyltransferase PglX [Sphaerotilaceae bacterium SBD11-9]